MPFGEFDYVPFGESDVCPFGESDMCPSGSLIMCPSGSLNMCPPGSLDLRVKLSGSDSSDELESGPDEVKGPTGQSGWACVPHESGFGERCKSVL